MTKSVLWMLRGTAEPAVLDAKTLSLIADSDASMLFNRQEYVMIARAHWA